MVKGMPKIYNTSQQNFFQKITVNCTAAAMAVVDGGNRSRRQWVRQSMAAAAMASLPLPSMPMMGWWRRHQPPLHS
jgi:hypothetical protein